jgi:hypothetical protein
VLGLKCCHEINGDANLVNLKKIAHRKVGFIECHLSHTSHILGEHSGNLLSDKATCAPVTCSRRALPLFGVFQRADRQFLKALKQLLSVDRFNRSCDPFVSGFDDRRQLGCHVGNETVCREPSTNRSALAEPHLALGSRLNC